MSASSDTAAAPAAVRLAALVAAVEGLALLGLALFFLVELAVSTPTAVGAALGALVFELLGAAILLTVARGLQRARRWARSPSVVLQILFLPVGFTLAFQAGQPWWGIPVLALALCELYLLFTPGARLALDRERDA